MIDLLAPEVFRAYSARPKRLREITSAAQGKIIIIDEVQKIPELLDVVHQLFEDNAKFQFILTGSSARKLRRTGVYLLAGRALVKTMHPFMAVKPGSHLPFLDRITGFERKKEKILYHPVNPVEVTIRENG